MTRCAIGLMLSFGVLVVSSPAADPPGDATQYIQSIADVGGTIPDGVFLISECVILRKSLTGSAATEIKASKAIRDGMFGVAGNVSISSLKIDGSLCRTVFSNKGKVTGFQCTNCQIMGGLPTTRFLIDLNGEVSNVEIDSCQLSTAYYAIRLRDKVNRARISNCTIKDWRDQAILVRSGNSVGPQYVTIEDNHISSPAVGKGSPRQMICAYGDPENSTSNIIGLKILNNTCIGSGEFFDADSETTRATGDQIVLHRCLDFSVIGNRSSDGGENGIAITQFCYRGVVANNIVQGNDCHGIQISSLGKRSSDIHVIGNQCTDNALRNDGSADVMSGLYVQDGARIVVQDNLVQDTRVPRKHKSGILIGSSNDISGSGNRIEFADLDGAKPMDVFNSRGVDLEVRDSLRE